MSKSEYPINEYLHSSLSSHYVEEALELLIISSEILHKFPDIQIGISILQGVSITKRSTDLKRRRKAVLKQFREQFSLSTFLNHHMTVAYANFYRKLGLDPQVTPPGPQNLITRLFTKNHFPTINTLVDFSSSMAVLNFLSISDARWPNSFSIRIALAFSVALIILL